MKDNIQINGQTGGERRVEISTSLSFSVTHHHSPFLEFIFQQGQESKNKLNSNYVLDAYFNASIISSTMADF